MKYSNLYLVYIDWIIGMCTEIQWPQLIKNMTQCFFKCVLYSDKVNNKNDLWKNASHKSCIYSLWWIENWTKELNLTFSILINEYKNLFNVQYYRWKNSAERSFLYILRLKIMKKTSVHVCKWSEGGKNRGCVRKYSVVRMTSATYLLDKKCEWHMANESNQLYQALTNYTFNNMPRVPQ